MTSRQDQKKLVVISGYYGFGNLGDEAILEQLTIELKQFVAPDEIVVLSSLPDKTGKDFGISACSRWNPFKLASLLRKARLLVSGGGGLFQETRSPGSVLFYAGQIFLARAVGCPCVVYGQGIGPFKTGLGRTVTARAMSACSEITVRDSISAEFLKSRKIKHELTADPVWSLAGSPLPDKLSSALKSFLSVDGPVLGISLRASPNLKDNHLASLVSAMKSVLPDNCRLVMMSFQDGQDRAVLEDLAARLESFPSILVRHDDVNKPSQWLTLMTKIDFMIAMRMHAALMALKQGVPTLGIAYDPKVSLLLDSFGQTTLNLANDKDSLSWAETLGQAFANRKKLSPSILKKAEDQKKLACHNIKVLARILNMQSGKEHAS